MGMAVLINDGNQHYGQKDFTKITSTEYRYRYYVDPNGLAMPNNTMIRMLGVADGAGGRHLNELRKESDGYKLYLRVKVDDGSYHDLPKLLLTDEPHCIEVLAEKAVSDSSNNGKVTVWIDGVLAHEETGLDYYNFFAVDNVKFGCAYNWNNGVSGTYYMDELVYRDDATEIGPLAEEDAELRANGNVIIECDKDNDDTDKRIVFSHDSGTELMRIQEDGKVGIGTTSPSEKLEIKDDSTVKAKVKSQNGGAWLVADTSAGVVGRGLEMQQAGAAKAKVSYDDNSRRLNISNEAPGGSSGEGDIVLAPSFGKV